MAEATTKPVINIDDMELMDFGHGDGFAAKPGRLGNSLDYWDGEDA